MPEALTESFCERCGTRYEFEAPAELNPLRKTRGLISGLRNYIMSQDALGDAIGDAIRSEEQQLAARQLEAFHSTFNFCIDCRQYACTNCWNDAAGRCRSCAPIPGKDDLADRLEAAYLDDHRAMHAAGELDVDEISRRLGAEAWPQSDLPEEAAAAAHGEQIAWPEAEIARPPAEIDLTATGDELEMHPLQASAGPEPTLESAPPEAAEVPAPSEAEEPVAPTRVLAWEEDAELILRRPIEEALPEPEAAWVAEAEPEPEPMPEPVAAEAEPEPMPEPVAAEAEPEPMPEPVAAEAEPEPVARTPRPIRPIAETILRLPPRAPAPEAVEMDEALAARKAQLDLLGLEDPGVGRVAPERPRVLPYRSSGAAVNPSEMMQRTLGASSVLWDASAREVAAAGSAVAVQNCGSCGLSLSASARFCRRCGTRQARSA